MKKSDCRVRFFSLSSLGTWPSYRRTLDFHLPAHYILISTSFTPNTYNCTSHLTFPLFHSDYPSNLSFSSSPPPSRSILLSFKGKSYEDVQHHRTFFQHLHNNRDIIIEYTDQPNITSNPLAYIDLLRQSHFCLVPTGRRLSSYRFLEVLQYGCIPVITTNENESLLLPFSEIIDWSKVVIISSNDSLSLLPYRLRMIRDQQRNEMQRECFNIWSKYFSSIERIVLTSLDILQRRFMSLSSSSLSI